MLQLVESKIVPVTLETLAEFRAIPPLPGERPFKPNRMNEIIILVRNSLFNYATWSILRDKNTGEMFRCNGQHTSAAFAALGADLPAGLFVKWEVFETDDAKNDNHILFGMFDNSKSARGNEDWTANWVASYQDLRGVPPKFLVHIQNGIQLHNKTEVDRIDAVEKAKAAKTKTVYKPTEHPDLIIYPFQKHGMHFDNPDNRTFALWAYGWVGGKKAGRANTRLVKNEWMLGNSGTVAAMYANRREQPELAHAFWDYVLRENHPNENHDTRELADVLMDFHRGLRKHRSTEYLEKAMKYWRRFVRDNGDNQVVVAAD